MGSFNATCIVSHLPIEAGDPVRYLALTNNKYDDESEGHVCYVNGRWGIRTPPLCGKYNDYGSVKDFDAKSLVTRVFFESFNRDAIECGIGNNSSHDVAVRHGMSNDEWLEALWEGRIRIADKVWKRTPEEEKERYEPGKGYPSIRKLEKIITDEGFKLSKGSGSEGFAVDEFVPGLFRIREGSYILDTDASLNKLLPFIDKAGYAGMITCGSGNYSTRAQITVGPKPATDPNEHICINLKPLHDRVCSVAHAMIREDVWQILLADSWESWGPHKIITIDLLKEEALAFAKKYKEDTKKFKKLESIPHEKLTEDERDEWFTLKFRDSSLSMHRDENIFGQMIFNYRRQCGVSWKESFSIAMELAKSEKDFEKFLFDLVETVFVESVYDKYAGQWNMSTNNHQEVPWKDHHALHQKFSEIKGKWEDYDEDEDIEDK